MVETFYELDDLTTAIEAVRSVSSLPIVALMTFDADGETPGGVTRGGGRGAPARARRRRVRREPRRRARRPRSTALAAMGGALPLAALPNLGLASRWGNRIVYPHADDEYFGDFAAQARDLGARIVGGCCGTTPVQIAAIREALKEERPVAPADLHARAVARPARRVAPRGEPLRRARCARDASPRRSRSTRRRAARSTACSISAARCATPARSSSSTSPTTTRRARG